jgi:hypothetical protein
MRFDNVSPKLLRAAVPSVPKAAPRPVPLEVLGTLELAFGALGPAKFPSSAANPELLELLGATGVTEDEVLDPPNDIPALPS